MRQVHIVPKHIVCCKNLPKYVLDIYPYIVILTYFMLCLLVYWIYIYTVHSDIFQVLFTDVLDIYPHTDIFNIFQVLFTDVLDIYPHSDIFNIFQVLFTDVLDIYPLTDIFNIF